MVRPGASVFPPMPATFGVLVLASPAGFAPGVTAYFAG